MLSQLKKWLRGDADWKSEQQLNQLGKKDAFLKDAMDGYKSMPKADHTKAISGLKGKLQKQYPTNSGTNAAQGIAWKGIAAAAALVGAISLFFWMQRDIGNNTAIVQAEPTRKIEKVETIPPVTTTAENKLKEEAETDQEEDIVMTNDGFTKDIEETSVPTRPELQIDPSNIEAGVTEEADLVEADNSDFIVSATSPDMVVSGVDTVEDAIASSIQATPPTEYPAESIEAAAKETVSEESDEEIGEIASAPIAKAEQNNVSEDFIRGRTAITTQSINTLNGRVVDLDSNEGLIGVSVYNKNTGEGTVTDIDGNFQLPSDTELPWTVVSAYTGYNNQELTITDLEGDIEIGMDTDGVALDEVTVTGYSGGAKKKRSKDAVETPKPTIGFKKMKRYIRKNMKYPEIAEQNKIQGGVTIRFFINAEGEPEQFSVINSLGGGCDAEAERLIEEGPTWEPKNVWAIYTVVFSL